MNIVVILAAGRSRRTTGLKQLYPVHGEYLINVQIQKLRAYGYRVALVLGYEAQRIETMINQDVELIVNKEYEKGMFSSVKAAFSGLDASRIVLCHVDRPIADREVFEKLFESSADIAVASYKGQKAPPVMIQSSMKEALLHSSCERLDVWIEQTHKALMLEIDDEKVLYNANTDETLRRYFA